MTHDLVLKGRAACSQCAFYSAKNGYGDVAEDGECRRRPPISAVKMLVDGYSSWFGVWPVVDCLDWCGEFEWSDK